MGNVRFPDVDFSLSVTLLQYEALEILFHTLVFVHNSFAKLRRTCYQITSPMQLLAYFAT